MEKGKWLFYKWWYLTILLSSIGIAIAGFFGIFPFVLIGGLGITACFLAYHRLDQREKNYGLRLRKYRFRQWWWWLIAIMSLAGFSSEPTAFLLGIFFMLLAALLLFMPPA